jgi:signal transduction histidine kinase/CheY-like chemotaxis protein
MDDPKHKLRTVSAPDELVPLFARAEELVSSYFEERRDDPERGTIEIFGERYLLIRAASLSVEFFSLVRDLYGEGRHAEADAFARNLLFDLAHAVGRSDARRFHERMKLEDPIERLTAGPVHFSHTGWAFVDIFPESNPVPNESYYLIYDHPYSFEAGAWLAAEQAADFPACIMNSGYSSGWCQESFGVRLVASEVLCRARGDDECRFIMAHPDRIEGFVERYIEHQPHLAGRIRGYQIPDFFARKRMEEELRRARDELEQRVDERTAEIERANLLLRREMEAREHAEKQLLQTAKLEAVGRLAGGIAHDFNNLMAVVIGHASHLENRVAGDDPLRTSLGEIRRAGEEAAQLTQQLLAFSRARLLHLEPVDLNEVVDEMVAMLERLIGENVALGIKLDDAVGTVRADRGQLRQVIMNLVVNARDAMPAGGELRIETSLVELGEEAADSEPGPGEWALLRVSDSGVGMDDETMSRAFDPFFTTKEPGAGTGLGLSTVHRIVTQCEGFVSVTSEAGQGTTFRIHLPRTGHAIGRQRTIGGEELAPGGHETVLVVEDQSAVRLMVVEVLNELGYAVIEASNPVRALELAGEHRGEIDLLLTDVVMPRMSGRELADRLATARPSIKVLYMSGYADDDVLRYGIAHGEVELLPKPFSNHELAQRVRRVLDG